MNVSAVLPSSLNLPFLEDLYAQYRRDPSSVPADWRRYFDGLSASPQISGNGDAPSIQQSPPRMPALQERVDQLIRNYRVRGHRVANLNPVGGSRPRIPELDPTFYGFSDADMALPFSCQFMCEEGALPLKEIIERLRATYCRSIGVQFMHIDDLDMRRWLEQRMEATQNRLALDRSDQIRILTKLTDAVLFEEFIRRKFIGAKSFSLEGSESLIPLLDLVIEKASRDNIDEIVFAMAHRGRLNVLANILGKSPRAIFREFSDADPELFTGRGDVKYHLGHSSDWTAGNGRNVHLSMCFNPSHLEFVSPVALGRMRAKQDRAADEKRERGMVLLIHGDASFAGQGVVQETLNLSALGSYSVGGALHVVVNNQIGFTTSPDQLASSTYCTDVAKMLQTPVFHVNGEDPEAVAQVVELAMDFRKAFKRDVIIDMYCYRRLGHNEGDEPSFTQPLLYKAIASRKNVREGYLDHLLELGGVTREQADGIEEQRLAHLSQELLEAEKQKSPEQPSSMRAIWTGYLGGAESSVSDVGTGVERQRLAELLEGQTRTPDGFQVHPKLKHGMQRRIEMARGARPLDWAAAEALAFASLASEGTRIRLTGQDSERGTYSHRHSVLHDVETGARYEPFENVGAYQSPVEIRNSPLSEAGVLGFEYGYSLDCPEGLILWEAQYGDFWNAAQVIVDQFIAGAEDKWRRLSGLVMLLPHGFEGSGPEHSSARLERFLQLAAEDNIQVTYPTTPAQFFHLLRRQVLRRWRKPLIVMTPKSLLRHPRATSSLDELETGTFRRILANGSDAMGDVRLILMCAGKIYYELEEARESLQRKDTAILRVEQLYPLGESTVEATLSSYAPGTPVRWVQEEPENMGAWLYLQARFGKSLLNRFPFSVISRPASASPATGSASSHKLEQQQLISRSFEL